MRTLDAAVFTAMTKKPPPGLCVYCLQPFSDMEWEHVIARSWYPTSKPENVELPCVPACSECNRTLGALETRVREQLGFMIDPWIEGGEGLGDSSFRAIDPSATANDREKARRAAKQERFRENVSMVREVPAEKMLPNIGRIEPDEDGLYMVSTVSASDLGKVIRKWVRGFAFYFEEKYLDDRYIVQAKEIGQEGAFVLKGGWRPAPLRIGPGVIVERKITPEDPVVGFYIFTLWGRMQLIGAVVTKEFILEKGKQLFM